MRLRSRRASPRQRLFSLLAVLMALALLLPLTTLAHHRPDHPGGPPAAPDPVEILVLNVSDWHGQLDPSGSPAVGGAWSLKARWDEDRAAFPGRSLTLTAGDDFGATPPLSSFFDEVPAVLAQRMMGIQVNTLGNHNWDRGFGHLQQMINLAGAPTSASTPGNPFKYVSANLKLKGSLSGVEPMAWFDIAGAKVAVIGITNEEAPNLVFPNSFGRTEVTDSVAAANKYAKMARQQGANAVLVITHKGVRGFDAGGQPFGELIDFANGLDPALVDVVFGDHTDVRWDGLINGILVHENRSKGVTYARTQLTVQPGRGGGVVDKSVDFVTPLSPARTTAQLVAAECPPLDADPPIAHAQYCDTDVLEMLVPFRQALFPILDVRVATATATFPRGGNVERREENALGNLLTDGMRWFQDTDFALMNGGGIRAPLPSTYAPLDGSLVRPPADAPWDIVLGDIYEVQPFGNTVLRRTVTGAQLWSALENGVSQFGSDGLNTDGRFAHVSGFKYTFDYSKTTGCTGTSGTATWACTPSRVISVTRSDGTPIPADGTVYTLATMNFINQGGDAYRMLLDGQTGENEVLDALVIEAYLEHLGPLPALTPTIEDRITKCGPCP